MLDLPDGFSLLDFEECSMFACQILLDQISAENGFEANHEGLTVEEVKGEFPRLAEYITLQIEQGISVAYYYYLIKHFPYHYECQEDYKDVIINCEGGSSKPAELPAIYLSGGEEIEKSFFGVTAHEAVFIYIRDIYKAVKEFCIQGDGSDPSIDVIRHNMSLVKEKSECFYVDTDDAQRTACEMNRELLLVTGQYGNNQNSIEIPSTTTPRLSTQEVKSQPLSNPQEKAYQSCMLAENSIGEGCTHKEAYNWLREQGPNNYTLPEYDTWERYVRAGRKYYSTQKNSPRAGRSGRFADPAD